MTAPMPVPDDASPEAEQQALYQRLLRELEGADAFNTRIIRIKGLQRSGKDHRLLFRTFLANVDAEMPLTFIEDLHNLLVEYGMSEPHTVINRESLAAASGILDAVSYYSIPHAKNTYTRGLREYINHALTLNSPAAVEQFVRERRPTTLEKFKAIHDEYLKTAIPLRTGVL